MMVDAPASFLDTLLQKMRATSQLALQELGKPRGNNDGGMMPMSSPRPLHLDKKVLLLLPSSSNKLLVEWQGPYEIIERVGEVNYRV